MAKIEFGKITLISETATWYLGFALLKESRYQEAKKHFQEIQISPKNYYKENAKELLDSWPA